MPIYNVYQNIWNVVMSRWHDIMDKVINLSPKLLYVITVTADTLCKLCVAYLMFYLRLCTKIGCSDFIVMLQPIRATLITSYNEPEVLNISRSPDYSQYQYPRTYMAIFVGGPLCACHQSCYDINVLIEFMYWCVPQLTPMLCTSIDTHVVYLN